MPFVGRDWENAMAFQRVPNTAEVDVIYVYNGETVQNTFYAKFGGVYGQANLQTLADDVDANIASGWLANQPIEAVYNRTEVRGLNAENDFLATANAGAGPGTDLVAAFPNNVTFSIKKASAFTGRSARGRVYWIGIPRDKTISTDENVLTAAYITAVVASVEGLRVVINTSFNWDAVLVSRFTGGIQRTEGITFPWLTTVAVDTIIDTQRGRLPG